MFAKNTYIITNIDDGGSREPCAILRPSNFLNVTTFIWKTLSFHHCINNFSFFVRNFTRKRMEKYRNHIKTATFSGSQFLKHCSLNVFSFYYKTNSIVYVINITMHSKTVLSIFYFTTLKIVKYNWLLLDILSQFSGTKVQISIRYGYGLWLKLCKRAGKQAKLGFHGVNR